MKAKHFIWIAVWLVTRALIVAEVGFWQPGGAQYQDVGQYEAWSNTIVGSHALPPDESWQYPPGAAFLMLVPRIGGNYGTSFVVLMLVFDLVGFWLMTRFAAEEGKETGVWIWLLAMPLLFSFPVLRFDLVPTVLAVAALLLIHRRPAWFGALAGIGGMVKVWPIFVLFGEWDRRRLLRSVAAALAAAGAILLASLVLFGGTFGFLDNQAGRGLQVEAVAASPWELRQVINGKEAPVEERSGTLEIASGSADAVAQALDLLTLVVLAAAAAWWWLRERAIAAGRDDLADLSLSRDFVFAIVLWLIVVSRVLSPQYLIWMVGLCAVVLSSSRTRLTRPAWVVVGAIVLTAGLYQSPANFLIRNLALVAAALDASAALLVPVLRSGVSPASPRPAAGGRRAS